MNRVTNGRKELGYDTSRGQLRARTSKPKTCTTVVQACVHWGGGTNGHHRPFRDRCICRRGTKTIEFRIRLKRTGIASPSGIPITHDGQRYIQFTGWESGIRTSYVFALLRRPVANPSLDWEAVPCEKKGRIQCLENYDIVHDTPPPPPREQIAFEVALFYVCLVTWVCIGVVILPGGNTLAVRLDRDRLPR